MLKIVNVSKCQSQKTQLRILNPLNFHGLKPSGQNKIVDDHKNNNPFNWSSQSCGPNPITFKVIFQIF